MKSNLPFTLNLKGYVNKRESFDLEFKANFQYGDSLAEYCRSMVGMAKMESRLNSKLTEDIGISPMTMNRIGNNSVKPPEIVG